MLACFLAAEIPDALIHPGLIKLDLFYKNGKILNNTIYFYEYIFYRG